MFSLIVMLFIAECSALELGSQIYPETAVLHANFTDGSLAIIKSYDEQLYLCENEGCTCKNPITLHQTQAYTEDDYFSISALSICDIDCVPCSFTGFDWECNCPQSFVMTRNIQCASTCPSGQQPGPSGLCEPKQNANWVKLLKEDQRMPNHDFTFHIDAKPYADTLLSIKDFVIGSNYVEILGRRHDFPDAQCVNDVCTYTVSADEDRVVFWVDKELAGTAPVTRVINLHSGKKIEGSGVINTWYRAGVAGPQKLHPSAHRQLQGIDNCSSKCMEGECIFAQDPTSCIICAMQYYEYCTEYDSDVACPYFICLEECGSGIIMENDPYRRCYRAENSRYERTIWDKFEAYMTDHMINEFKYNIGVNLIGGAQESYEIVDPVPAFQRGLYYNGYSAVSTFQGLNLGTDFNIGFWLKPFHFDALFSVFDNRSGEMILQMIRREPENENEVTSIAWTMKTEENVSNFYATSIADKQFEAFYELENIWWLLTLRVNAGYSADANDFAASFRIYYNNQFGGDTINLERDYFEDSASYLHVVGRDLSWNHFHGFIGDVIYYNWGEANFPELMVSGVEECISCEICPSTVEYFECRITGTERTCNRNVDVRNWCPDCCESGLIWIEGECVGCGNLCISCSTHETSDSSLDAGNCDFCVEYAELDDPPGRDCVCIENYSYDAENNRCCEPHCATCPLAPFECERCFFGYLLQDKVGFDNIGLPLLGNECIQNNCFGGVPSGDNLCQCPRGWEIIGEVCDDNNECTCNSLDCTCTKIPCHPFCALCNVTENMSACFFCEEGYIDIAPTVPNIDDQYAFCVEDCPSGFFTDPCEPDPDTELIIKFQFNYPISEFENLGAVRINLEIETDFPSGALAKNRGIHFDGVGDAYVELSFFALYHSWTVVTWLYPMMNGNERMVFFQKEDTFLSYIEGDVMGVEILSQQITDTGGFAQTGLVTRQWQFISQEYELYNGASTDIRMFIDDQPMLTATANNFQLDAEGIALLGLQHDDGFINKFHGYYFDVSIIQSSIQENYRTLVRTTEGCAAIDCWSVEFNQYQSDNGSVGSCSADCIDGQKGCINARDCREDCINSSEWCHLCYDYECQDCTTYDTCEADSCAENSQNFDESICRCDEPEYGRDFNIDAPCAQCDPACDTCVIEGIAGCLTCTPGVRRMVDPDNLPSQCICIDGKYPDPTHADCGDCHSNCITCFGKEAWECIDQQWANGRYQWTTSTWPDALHLCLIECPTGYITHEAPFRYCERPSLSNWQFDYFPRTNIDLDVDGMTIRSCFDDAPVPVYGRGVYFDGINNCLELGPLNMGTEFSLQFWFRADEPDTNFTNLVSVADAPSETEIFNIGLSDGGDTVQVTFVSTYGNTSKSTSLTAREARNYSISGQWNSLGYTSWAVKNGSDSQMRFGTEMRFFINAYRPADVLWEYGEYMEDNQSFSHKIGFGADANAYKGHIATINFFNFRVEDFDNISQITTSSCPTCTSCPVEKAYTECVDDCEFDFTGTCISTNCDDLKVPICPVNCDIGHYQEANFDCTPCTEGGDSCRIEQNDRVCDDILCTSCEPLYGECNHPDSCVTFASEVDGDCACDQYYQINSITNTCERACHEICEACDGPNRWQCTMCMPGFYEVPIREPFKSGILCLTECPTAFRANGPRCVRQDSRAYVFDFFRRQDIDLDVRGLQLYGGSRARSDPEDPTPVYGRGLYFDGTTIQQFGEFNMGQDFTFSVWFCPYRFGTLYTVADSSGSILSITESELDEQKVTQLDLNLTLGTSYVYQSSGQLSLVQDHGWSLENQWNNMAINLRSHYYIWDDAQGEFSFAGQINMFMNHYGMTDNIIIENDYWSEDNLNNSHIVGRNFERSSSFDGFIGDVIYGNYAYYTQLDYVTSTYPVPPSCPSAVEASESKHYIDCVEDCEIQFASSSQVRVDNCIRDDCNHDPFCADVCPIDQFMDEDNDFACTECDDGCPSCRNGVTCDGCDDIRCAGCSTYYNICDGGCKPNADWDDRNEICVCQYEFDWTSYNCCFENCLVCSDPVGPCDQCAEFYFGDFCETRCVNGTYVPGSPGFCSCTTGWSSLSCEIPCHSDCVACSQTDEDLCTDCGGNKIGDLCELCSPNWFAPGDCTVECINGTYVVGDPGTCSCDIGWSASNCNTPCNSLCYTCMQTDEETCTECPGNQALPYCDICLQYWFGDFCETRCVNGTYVPGSPGFCSCTTGWSSLSCEIPCHTDCVACSQTDENLCTDCGGNKIGDECELCLPNWFAPGDCTVECINGTYVEGDPGTCSCDPGWSASNCNTPCNSLCYTCLQTDPETCTECPGNQALPKCDVCLPNWFDDDCETLCYEGQGFYIHGTRGICSCLAGWSGPACATPCMSACYMCSQSDEELCTECPGNYEGDRCDRCIPNWDIDFLCEQCLPQYFHESAENRGCQLFVTNGVVIFPDQLDYECFEFYAQAPLPAPRGECVKNECFGGCKDCTTNVDYRDCMACKTDQGWADPDELEKTDGQQRTCTFGCPSGYQTVTENPLQCAPSPIKPLSSPQASYDFNFPSVNYSNTGYVPEVDIAVCTDGFSGIPAKNRGLCLDGTGNGVIFIEKYLLNPSFTVDIWFLLRERNGDQVCSLMYKRDLMDIRVTYGDDDLDNEMGTVIGTEGSTTIHDSSAKGVFTNIYQRLIYSYTHIDGRATDAKYYIDGGIVKYETLEDRIIIDDITKSAYVGGKYAADSETGCSELINKCNGCIYDFVMTQVAYVPETMNRVETGEEPTFWDVPMDEWVDASGDVQECDASCIYGCVDGAVCKIDFDDECQFCYLCHDRECISCDSYPVCDVCQSSRSEEDGEGGCVCLHGWGRRDKAEKCVECHFSCDTCIGPDEDDCTSCREGNQLTEAAPAKCICNDKTYPNMYVTNCSNCHPSCANCIGPLDTHCTECHPSAFLEGFSPNKCTCYDGFYMPSGTDECFACHPTCKNCTGPEITDCYECHHGAYITITNECFCYEGPVHEFTTETDASACEITECSPNCSSCFTYPWRCDGCLQSSLMINNFCDCPEGFTYQPDTDGDPCVPDEQCHYTCETCAFENDPNSCRTCHNNASVRFDDRPTWCDCDRGFYPSWTTNNCVPLPPITIFTCEIPCVTCLEMDPSYCTSCEQGAELSGTTCVCEEGFVAEPDAGHCTQICPEFCTSCLLSDTSLCTYCVPGYFLSHYWPTVEPSPCVPLADLCPDFCCECDITRPGTCISCCPGYKLERDAVLGLLTQCVEDKACHHTCLTCVNSSPNECLECHPNAHIEIPLPPFRSGACVCNPKWLETPDSSNCIPNCAENCETCSGPEEHQCLTCNPGYTMVQEPPCNCTHMCHIGCKECWGNDYNQCTLCGENMNLYYGQCLCDVGYEMDPDLGCVHVGPPKYSEFVFNHCASNFQNGDVGLVGDSAETASLYPLPVNKRGVFFNNKTYFRMTGLTLGSNFAMNTWIKSHDTGYATIFSVNGDCLNQGSTVSEFSWRIANGKRTDKRRHNAQELTDWSHAASNVLLQSIDKSYRPCYWNNLAFSVDYEFENDLSTITFYSLENDSFYIRAQISSGRKFMRTSVDNDYSIGNRLSLNDEPVNSFLGFMYYYAVYSYAENDFDRSLGQHCHNCSTECGPHNTCLSNCWYDEHDSHGECCECDAACQTCYFDTKTCYCDNKSS